MLIKVQIPTEAGNKAIKDGSLPRLIQGFTDKAKPDAVYFGTSDGKRTMFAVFDMTSPDQTPSLAEPLFQGLDATIELMPVMNAADLRAGLAQL
jgi:hypothetical protein